MSFKTLESEGGEETFTDRYVLANILKEFPIVLHGSLPADMARRESAWEEIKVVFARKTKKFRTVRQLKRLLKNMKSYIKKRTDPKVTRNVTLRLMAWEKIFLEVQENPVYCKVPGALVVGVVEPGQSTCTNGHSLSPKQSVPEVEPNQIPTELGALGAPQKKRKLNEETKETADLSILHLQRLLLLEQIKLTKLRIKREEMLNEVKMNIKRE